jgi:hypothetical protein
MSGSLSDLFGYAGDNPVGAAPQQQSTLADVLARLKALYGSASGAIQNGVGAAQNTVAGAMAPQPVGNLGLMRQPDGSVGTPGGGFQPPPQPAQQAPQQAPAQPPMAPQQGPVAPTVAQPAPPPGPAAPPVQDQQSNVYAAPQGQPQAASSATPANYSTAAPPPNAGMALVVQDAAKRYGVPQDVANWVGFHESNWNPNVGTNSYGATGPWQFKAATAQQYGLQDPTDFNSSTDAAMRYLSDLYKKTGNWADAVASYGTFSTGRGGDIDQAARKGFLQYAQNTPNLGGLGSGVQVAGPGAPTDSHYTPEQRNQLSALGIDPSQFKLPFDYQQAVQPSLSEKLYRMAAALTGHPEAAANAMAQDRQKMFEANNNELASQRLFGQLAYNNGRLGQGDVRNAIGVTNAQTAQGRLGVAQQALQGRLDPTLQGQLAGVRANAQQGARAANAGVVADEAASGKDASTDRNTLFKTAQQDQATMADNTEALHQLDANPQFFGSGMAQTLSRTLAQQGITPNGNDLDAVQKALATSRNQYLTGLFNGHVGPLRAFQADKMFAAAQADLTTRPDAARWIVQMNQYALQTKNAWRQEALQMYSDPVTRGQVEAGNYSASEAKFYDNYLKNHPIPQYQSGSTAAPTPGTNPDGTTKGVAPPISSFWKQ